MPEQRLARTRRTLPDGYQFLDSATLRQAERRLVDAVDRNRIEIGEPIVRPMDANIWIRTREGRDALQRGIDAMERAKRDQVVRDWNVIEGEEHHDEWGV